MNLLFQSPDGLPRTSGFTDLLMKGFPRQCQPAKARVSTYFFQCTVTNTWSQRQSKKHDIASGTK
jgi:hypothetical protein